MATKQRVRGNGGIDPVAFRPGTSPVDTFIRPTAGQKLSQLAQGLSTLAPSLGRFSDQMAAEDAEKNKAEGDLAARQAQESGKTYQQAIQEGLIRPDQSPWFRQGFKDFYGRNVANQYGAQLSAVARERLKDSTSIEDFNALDRGMRAEFLKTQVGDNRDSTFEGAFGRQVDSLVDGLRREFAPQMGQNLQRRTSDELSRGFYDTMVRVSANSSTYQGAEWESLRSGIAGTVMIDAQRAIAMGMNRETVEKALAQSVLNAAQTTGDARIVDILKDLRAPGGESDLMGLEGVAEAARRTQASIRDVQWNEWSRGKQREDVTKQDNTDTILTEASTLLLSDPTADLKPFAQRLIQNGDHAAARALEGYRGLYTNMNDVPTNEDLLSSLSAQIWDGRLGIGGLIGMIGQSINRNDFGYLMGIVNLRRGEDGRLRSGTLDDDAVFGDEAFKHNYSTFDDMLRGFDPGRTGGLVRDRASREMRESWIRYRRGEGANATYTQRNEWFGRRSEELREKYQVFSGMGDRVTGDPNGDSRRRADYETRRVLPQNTIGALRRFEENPGRNPLSPAMAQWMVNRGLDPRKPEDVRRVRLNQSRFSNPRSR